MARDKATRTSKWEVKRVQTPEDSEDSLGMWEGCCGPAEGGFTIIRVPSFSWKLTLTGWKWKMSRLYI